MLKKNPIYFIAGIVLGVVVSGAFVFISLKFIDKDNSPVSTDYVVDEKLKSPEHEHDRSTDTIDLLSFKDRIISMLHSTNSFDSPLLVHRLLKDFDNTQLVQLLAWSKDIADQHINMFLQEAIVGQIAMRDPTGALGAIEEHSNGNRLGLIGVVFQEWSVSDIESAVVFGSTLDRKERNAAYRGILSSRLDFDFGRALATALQLGTERQLIGAIDFAEERIVSNNAKKSWIELISFVGKDVRVFDDLELQSLSDFARAIIDALGSDAPKVFRDTLDTAKSTVFVGQVLGAIAEVDSRMALELAMDLELSNRDFLERIIRNFAETDPHDAMDTAIELGFVDGGRMQRAAIDVWARNDPYSLRNSVEAIPVNLQEWAIRQSLFSIARIDPTAAIPLMSKLQNRTLKKALIREIVRNWSRSDPEAAFEWTKSNTEVEEWADELRTVILETISPKDPTLALAIATRGDTKDSNIRMEDTVISILARSDVDKALDFLDRSGNSGSFVLALPEIGKALVRRGNTSKVLEIVQGMPIQDQRRFISSIANEWASSDYIDLFNKIDKLPDDQIVLRDVAIAIAFAQRPYNTSYTPAQNEFLEEHLPQEMHSVIE